MGLGASADSVGPLQQFFAEMPPESGLASVVVMHVSPEHESHLAGALKTQSKI